MAPKQLKIPLVLAGRADAKRMVRELAKLEEFFLASTNRQAGTPQTPPQITRLLNMLAEENQINLLQAQDREFLKSELEKLVQNAPSLHISFAVEPPPKVLEQILSWLRQNIHPTALVVVGLQPGIAAGVVLRTPNKIFDMSMKNYLERQEPYLIKLINEVNRG